jgi:hypothetical protein
VSTAESDALDDLLAVCLCVKRHNTAEFMAYFAERINAALESHGSGDRVEWPGKWAQEFRLVSGKGVEG